MFQSYTHEWYVGLDKKGRMSYSYSLEDDDFNKYGNASCKGTLSIGTWQNT